MRITPSASRNIRSFRLGERFRNSISRTEDDVVVLRCVRGICWDKFLQIFQVFGRSDPLDETIVLFSKNIEARIHAHLPAKLFRKPSRASPGSNGPQRIEQCLFFERVRAGREILHARKNCRFRQREPFRPLSVDRTHGSPPEVHLANPRSSSWDPNNRLPSLLETLLAGTGDQLIGTTCNAICNQVESVS